MHLGRRRALALAALLPVALFAGCGGGGGEDDDAAATTASGCRAVERPEPRAPETREAPDTILETSVATRAVVSTNCGSFTIELDAEASPNAASSFAALAEAGYFDGTTFHRIVRGFVVQGGDPTATGGGGPGYTTVDTPAAGTAYTRGVVAMAKTAAEPAGAAGSQFFVVTGEDIGLPPLYAVIGTVTSGLDVVDRIGRLGDASEQPTETVLIERVEIRSG